MRGDPVLQRYLSLLGAGLRDLARFSGRSARGQFWPYALTVLAAGMAVWTAVFIPIFMTTMNKMMAFAAAHPDQATVVSSPTSYSISIQGDHPELMPDMGSAMGPLAVVFAALTVLLAAAVTRRLHDRGWRGFLGLLPLPFVAFSLVQMGRLFASFGGGSPDLGLFFAVFFSNMAYIATLLFLTVRLAMPGTPGPNRFGPDPKA